MSAEPVRNPPALSDSGDQHRMSRRLDQSKHGGTAQMGHGSQLLFRREGQMAQADWARREGGDSRLGGPTSAPVSPEPRRQDEGQDVPSSALVVTNDDQRIDRIAQSRISVLIIGETGAGKEVLAQRIHRRSLRAGKPLVTVNCAAICASLIESQLFGHQRGAFTGADQAKTGLIEAADGGTLFLDELGELSRDAQTKLLRVLEERQVLPVGSVTPRAVDVRFIAATNVDLDAATAAGRFREDLLYRLEGIRLHVPPLRSRIEEVIPAARQFLEGFSAGSGQAVPVLTPDAETALRRHTWKGNFRELRNVVERAALICSDGRIEAADLMLPDAPAVSRREPIAISAPLPALHPPGGRPTPKPEPTSERERDRIIAALNDCAGNQTRAARMLGVSRRTLITRLEKFGLARPRRRPLRSLLAANA